MSGSDSGGNRATVIIQGRTLTTGFSLTNGTPGILSFITPNDGNLHEYVFSYVKFVTVLETGGAVTLAWTIGGTAQTVAASVGGQAAGTYFANQPFVSDPNTFVTLNQTSALTAGTSKVFASIMGQ